MKKVNFGVSITFCLLINLATFSQVTAIRQPKCLLDPTQDVEINQVISNFSQCGDTAMPWVVYSISGADYGDKYFVGREETIDKLHLYTGSGASGLRILNAQDKGTRLKSDVLFRFAAEFTASAHIHRKCVVLNSQSLIDSICMGVAEESQIPVYTNPVTRTRKQNADESGALVPSFLPLYSIYFVYSHTKNMYLLGREYKFDPRKPFNDQIIGWVDKHRVFDYNNRLCFEPNYETGPVRQRRCDTIFGNAKVFASPDEVGVFLSKKANIEPLWEEPDSFYVSNPRRFVSGDTFNIKLLRRMISPSLTAAVENLTNRERNPKFFRFPFLGMNRNDTRIFQVAATGRYVRSKKSICETLKTNKYRVNVYFILPDSLPNAYALFFLSQLNDKYDTYNKSFSGCFYPQQQHTLNIIRGKPRDQSYNVLRDSIMHHIPDKTRQVNNNCYSVLEQVLENEKFDIRETNLIVLLNSNRNPDFQPSVGNAISRKLAENNCYLLAVDFNNNPSFSATVKTLAKNAAGMFKQMHGLPTVDIEWTQYGKQSVMINYLLAVVSAIDTNTLKGPQMIDQIQSSITPLHSTLDRVIREECDMRVDSIPISESEIIVKRGLETLNSDCAKDLNSMRIMQMGFSRLTYERNDSLLWKAEVLMTDRELTDLISQLDGMSFNLTGSQLCNRICTLWQSLIERFIGQQLILDNSYLNMTIGQILNRMIGASFGYSTNDAIKRFSLRDICQGQQNVLEPADIYQKTLERKLGLLKQKKAKEFFYSFSGSAISPNIKYYWVPVNLLP